MNNAIQPLDLKRIKGLFLSPEGGDCHVQLKQTGIPYITATHDVNNPRSGKVMQALGMKYQYSYEELWQPKNFLVTFRMYQLNFDKEKTGCIENTGINIPSTS